MNFGIVPKCYIICFSFYWYVEAHDDSGPIPIQETAVTPLADIFLQGGEQIGYKSHDCNGEDGDIVGNFFSLSVETLENTEGAITKEQWQHRVTYE